MIKNSFVIWVFCILQSQIFAQKVIKCKIETTIANIGDIYITNINNNAKAIADKQSFFTINAYEN